MMTISKLRRLVEKMLFGLSLVFVGTNAVVAENVAEGLEAKPLAPRTAPRGATLFQSLAPEVTGIRTENKYVDPKMWGERYAEFEVGSIGTGVAIGDYDGDGRPDIFVVSKTESLSLIHI